MASSIILEFNIKIGISFYEIDTKVIEALKQSIEMKEKEKLASKSKLTPGSLLQGQLVKHPFPPLDYEEDPFKLKEQKPGYEDNAGALTVRATDSKSRKKGSRDHKPRLKIDEFQGGQGVQ